MKNLVIEENLKIPEHILKYVENELYSYNAYKLAVVELRLDLEDILSQYGKLPTDRIPVHTGAGDPVNLSALRSLIIEEKIKQNLGRIHKIEAGLELLNDIEKEVVEKKYFSREEYSNEQLIIQFHLNRNRFYKVRDDIIYKFSVIFGVL